MTTELGAPFRFFDSARKPVRELPEFAKQASELVALLRGIVLTRAFDTKAIALQRTGRLETYASSLGQEAVSVGVASAMHIDDVLPPSFRKHGVQFWRGMARRRAWRRNVWRKCA